jgi:hypothetical protein
MFLSRFSAVTMISSRIAFVSGVSTAKADPLPRVSTPAILRISRVQVLLTVFFRRDVGPSAVPAVLDRFAMFVMVDSSKAFPVAQFACTCFRLVVPTCGANRSSLACYINN